MIDYNDLENYYLAEASFVTMNAGGIFLELSENYSSLFYKIDMDHYADINHPGLVVQVLRNGEVITTHGVLYEDTLRPVCSKQDIIKNSGFLKRRKFDSSIYNSNK